MKNQKLAIVGMDAYFGACESLADFDRAIYEGKQFVNSNSSQELQNESRKVFSQELLALHVADNALNDAQIERGTKTAVIISYPSDYFNKATIEQVANNICHTWKLSGGSIALDLTKYSQFSFLQAAQNLLIDQKAHTVLCIEVTSSLPLDRSENAGAVVLKLEENARRKEEHIYALIEGIGYGQQSEPEDNNAVIQVSYKAMASAGVQPEQVNYLEVCDDTFLENETEIEGLIQAYQHTPLALSCALGTVRSNLNTAPSPSGMASLIKTALCLYHRYLPAFPQWSEPQNQRLWQHSPFYIASESRPWFVAESATARIAAINSIEADGTITHIILADKHHPSECGSQYLRQSPFYLFPIAADEVADILKQARALEQKMEKCPCLSDAASEAFAHYQQNADAAYTLVILGHNRVELQREIQRALKDLPQVSALGSDWQTPVGSYFTANPLGKKGKVTFVYPGSFNSYLGIFRDLFRLFPQIYDDPMLKSVNERAVQVGQILYPRSWHKLTKRKLEQLEKKLIADPTAMIESELACASFITTILQNYFQLHPQCSMGYSLGETTMMYAQGVWTNFNSGSHAFNTSPLFKGRVSGVKNTVREYWDLPTIQTNPTAEDEDFWGTYLLIASASEVNRCLQQENRVYLTQINTPQEVIVAGDPQACQRVMKKLGCSGLRIPFNLVMHCEPVKREYSELRQLHTLPIQARPQITFYSSANYEATLLESYSLGHDLAHGLSKQLDFPRLINRVYQDEVRIFIEIGAGNACSRWIDKTLKEREHLAVSFNRRGLDDHTSLLRALAKLVSHRVPLDLSPLYIRQPVEIALQPLTRLTSKSQFQYLSKSEAHLNQAHAAFLQAQEDLLRHMKELIQMQLTCCEQLISENSAPTVAEIDANMTSSKKLTVSQ